MTKKNKAAEEVIEGPYEVEVAKQKRELPTWVKSRAAKISAIAAGGALLLGGAFAAGAAVTHEFGDQKAGFSAQFGPADRDHDNGAFNKGQRPPHGPGDDGGFQPPAQGTAPDSTTTNP